MAIGRGEGLGEDAPGDRFVSCSTATNGAASPLGVPALMTLPHDRLKQLLQSYHGTAPVTK